ncbi:hypothetical protein [Chengkuizengella marina]|uniref:Uncharacterized protein n=1 Tax=Chengkuizengella marina TaxID=2507566 RepID=A0A6N9Q5X7_9BACL|nr:hypothetical protein [Chengkuizengella marina]NBI30258.1 hypothetical protein [Chengkuizengella marina]
MQYQLKIRIDCNYLDEIYKNNQEIVLMKGAGEPTVAWISFKPFEENTITWDENYSVYASGTEIEDGATINKLSERSAVEEDSYTFENGCFKLASSSLDLKPGSFGIINNFDENLTFGLAQDVTVHNKTTEGAPLNAVRASKGQCIQLTPFEDVVVFLQNTVNTGSVHSLTSTCNKTKIEFGGNDKTAEIVYDGIHFNKI